MCSSLKLVLSLSCFLFVGIFAEVDECKVSRCSPNGPAIRFPFWLRDHQPAHCGFPGFELSCTEKHHTMLNLSHSVKLLVKKINYKSQEIQVHDTDDCRLTQFSNLSLSSLLSIPCLSAPAYQVYAVYSSYSIDFELSSCRKIHNVLLPYQTLKGENIFPLNWDKPMCKSCEAEGGKCRLKKSNSKEPETQCVKVKILNNTNGNGEEFLNEVGTMGRIHHVNVVRLVGFCADGFRRALIYEFLPNESLEKFIFSRTIKNHSLGWKKLQDIALGGRKNIDVTVDNTSQVYFPEWIYNHLDQGEELQIRIDEEGDTQIVKKLTIIGLWCIQWFPADRPSMKLVVQMLEGEHNLSTPPNPFTCTTPTKTNASTSKRYLQQELTVISEIE
ncbi:Rust resistance kinase Lr10 [Vitis vinifera]|uniref:Rust resistance kinase Lr10 n=1 Tax=Vitis vinifera TaxID=29760 RepID=A0A438C4W2_VITVI|nr:Rust resistance kinase Lr10 [Vitis vinifera]